MRIANGTHVTAIAYAMVIIHAINTRNADAMDGLATAMVVVTGVKMMFVLLKTARWKAVGVISLATQMAVCVMATTTYVYATEVAIRITNVAVTMNVILKNAGHVIAIPLEIRKG